MLGTEVLRQPQNLEDIVEGSIKTGLQSMGAEEGLTPGKGCSFQEIQLKKLVVFSRLSLSSRNSLFLIFEVQTVRLSKFRSFQLGKNPEPSASYFSGNYLSRCLYHSYLCCSPWHMKQHLTGRQLSTRTAEAAENSKGGKSQTAFHPSEKILPDAPENMQTEQDLEPRSSDTRQIFPLSQKSSSSSNSGW